MAFASTFLGSFFLDPRLCWLCQTKCAKFAQSVTAERKRRWLFGRMPMAMLSPRANKYRSAETKPMYPIAEGIGGRRLATLSQREPYSVSRGLHPKRSGFEAPSSPSLRALRVRPSPDGARARIFQLSKLFRDKGLGFIDIKPSASNCVAL